MADDELCLADYDELDAAKQDHVLALIHQGASGNVAGRAVGWAGGPWLALGFPAAAPQQSPTAGEHGGSASQPVTTGMTRRPLPAAPRSLRGPPETRVPDSDQNAARQLEEVGRAPRASHDNVTDVAAPGGGDAARRPAERQRRARASPPPEKNIHVLPRSLSSTSNFVDVPSMRQNVQKNTGHKTLEQLSINALIKQYKAADSKIYDIEQLLHDLGHKLQESLRKATPYQSLKLQERVASCQDRLTALHSEKRGIELRMDDHFEHRMMETDEVRKKLVDWRLERKTAERTDLACLIDINSKGANNRSVSNLARSLMKSKAVGMQSKHAELVKEMADLKSEVSEIADALSRKKT